MIFAETKILVHFHKKIQNIIIIFHDFPWPWLFSMTLQAWKMVLLNSMTFQEDWSPQVQHKIENNLQPAGVHTSLTAHMRAIDPMLFVIVTSVAFARSALLTLCRRSALIMWPKLQQHNYQTSIIVLCLQCIHKHILHTTQVRNKHAHRNDDNNAKIILRLPFKSASPSHGSVTHGCGAQLHFLVLSQQWANTQCYGW